METDHKHIYKVGQKCLFVRWKLPSWLQGINLR